MNAGIVGGVTLVGGLVVASLLAPFAPPAPSTPPPQTHRPVWAPAAPVWIDIVRPLQLYDLSGSRFAKLPLAYGARRTTMGIARQDTLSFGTFGGAAPSLTLAITRQADAVSPPDADLVVDLARVAGGDGVALTRAGLPATLPTRFGDMAVADVVLQRGAVALPCLGFRLEPSPGHPQPIAMAGLACNGGTAGPDRADLACAIERIDLVSAGDDTALRDFFVEAERRRSHHCEMARAPKSGSMD